MATNIIRKLRDMFLVKSDGTRHNMQPGKHYIMTRQGTVEEVPDGDVDKVHDAYADNRNTLLALGSKGDLRQLETIIRNISNIHANAVMPSDIFHHGGNYAQLGSKETKNTSQYNAPAGQLITADRITIRPTAYQMGAAIWVEGLRNNTWEQIYSRSAETNNLISQGFPTSEKFESIRIRWNSKVVSRDSLSIDVIHHGRADKFLTTAESARISELVAEPYYLSLFVDGGIPSGEDLLRFVMPQRLYWRSGMAGKFGHVETPPNAHFSMQVYKNGSNIETMSVSTNGSLGMTSGGYWFEKGDVLTIKSQNTGDPGITGLAVTITMDRDV